MSYLSWLLVISAGLALAERLRPARPAQRAIHEQLGNDLAYLLVNGHLYAAALAPVLAWSASTTRGLLGEIGLLPQGDALRSFPFPLQAVVYLLVSDLLQWCVHYLLHHVPWLWQFHKVHHSAQVMDWTVNFRFHWMELVVYRSLLYVPLLWLGGDPGPLFAVAVFATFWGHLNHANLDLDLGPLNWILNGPRMHLWHHDASGEGGELGKNFGIVLSLWDWAFRTAYWPRDRTPERIGYPLDEEMPRGFLRQLAFPLTRGR